MKIIEYFLKDHIYSNYFQLKFPSFNKIIFHPIEHSLPLPLLIESSSQLYNLNIIHHNNNKNYSNNNNNNIHNYNIIDNNKEKNLILFIYKNVIYIIKKKKFFYSC